jgi:hypothetical protein
MERITRRSVAMTITLMLALASIGMSAPKSERARKRLTVEGRVLQKNEKARTLLVSDQWSKKLYLVGVPDGATLRIKFGMNKKQSDSNFEDVNRNDRVLMRCIRTGEHLAQLDDGRQVVVLTASR